MQVMLYKKEGKYTEKETQKEKRYVNFSVKVNDPLIPSEPCYFPNSKCDNRDPQFASRKGALEAIADPLPERDAQVQETA